MTATASEESTRARLVASARTLFTSGSYVSVGVQELCKDADVRRGSFYYHFESKQDLALAALEDEWDRLRSEVVEPAFGDTDDPAASFDRFQDLLHAYHRERAAAIGRFGGCLIVSLSQEMATIDETIRARAVAHLTKMKEHFASALASAVAEGQIEAVDVDAAAERILAYCIGTMSHARAQGSSDVIAAMKFDLLRLV